MFWQNILAHTNDILSISKVGSIPIFIHYVNLGKYMLLLTRFT